MKIKIAVLFLFLLQTLLGAEESEHERVGVKRETVLELSPSTDFSITTYTIDNIDYFEAYETLSINARLGKKLNLGLSVPSISRVITEKTTRRTAFQQGLGDVNLSGSYSVPDDIGNFLLGLDISLPTGDPNASHQLSLQSGSGFWNFGVNLKRTWYADPVLYSLSLNYGISPIAVLVNDELSFKPYDLRIGFGIIEVLNTSLISILNFGMQVSSGLVSVNNPNFGNSSFSVPISYMVSFDDRPWSSYVQIQLSLGNGGVYPSIGFGLSYAIEFT